MVLASWVAGDTNDDGKNELYALNGAPDIWCTWSRFIKGPINSAICPNGWSKSIR
jgi:hypothetical protein